VSCVVRPPHPLAGRRGAADADDIRIGAIFPGYELPYHTDTRRKLSFLQGGDPMVLKFNRSAFCRRTASSFA
jgi:peroxiredoxin